MQHKTPITAGVFIVVLAILSYLLVAAESLSQRELTLIKQIEIDVAQHLQQPTEELFPQATRITNKVHIGGNDPFIYKVSGTSGRPGQRIDVGYSLQRTEDKAKRKFATRWKHELRANSLGKLEEVELDPSLKAYAHLAEIHSGSNQPVGMFFLARVQRGIFSLVLKGITLENADAFATMLQPTLSFLEAQGPTLMHDEP